MLSIALRHRLHVKKQKIRVTNLGISNIVVKHLLKLSWIFAYELEMLAFRKLNNNKITIITNNMSIINPTNSNTLHLSRFTHSQLRDKHRKMSL